MSTVRDCVHAALRKIGINDPQNSEVNDAVLAFSDMVHGWRLQGVDIWAVGEAMNGGFPLIEVNIADFTAESPWPMPEALREAASYVLAERIAPEYGKAFDASRYMRQIQAAYHVPIKTKMPDMLFRMRPAGVLR